MSVRTRVPDSELIGAIAGLRDSIRGWGLIFQHPLLHEGSEVTSGTKYVARTDLMYRKIAAEFCE